MGINTTNAPVESMEAAEAAELGILKRGGWNARVEGKEVMEDGEKEMRAKEGKMRAKEGEGGRIKEEE